LQELQLSEGDTVLELAAGVGDTGFEVAERIGEQGRLISSDFSPSMLAAARERGEERGVSNVDYRILDAERIELADDSVDGVLCRFGYMLMAHPAAALMETRRVLRSGRRLALAVWATPELNPFFTIIAGSLVQRGHIPPPEPPPAPGLFAMASPERVHELLHGAGFSDVRTQGVELRFRLPGIDEYVAFMSDTAGPLALTLRGLSSAELAELKAEVEASLEPFATGDGYELPGVALCTAAE
jgi:SAM-dependent methyltransferase